MSLMIRIHEKKTLLRPELLFGQRLFFSFRRSFIPSPLSHEQLVEHHKVNHRPSPLMVKVLRPILFQTCI